MPLEDFLAKKERKKSKKTKNRLDLLEQLAKETETIPIQESGPAVDEAPKLSVPLEKEDEWEPIGEDKEIDLDNIRIGKLSIKTDSGTKSSSKNKHCDSEPVEEKKVWAVKPAEVPAESEVKAVESPSKPEIYIPAPLRANAKPNVSSLADFPTLDAALANATPAKKTDDQTEVANDSSWQQAAVRRTIRPSAPVTPSSTSAYVPPSLRQGAGGEMKWSNSYEPPAVKSGDGLRGMDNSWRRAPENSGSNNAPSGGDWVRGATIGSSNVTNSVFSSKFSSPRKQTTTTTEDGFIQNVRMKVCKSTIQEKPQFELIQSNRFAGLNEI